MVRDHLIIFTERYPFGQGETFVGLELPYLVRAFRRVTVVPRSPGGTLRMVPPNVEVDGRGLDRGRARLRPELLSLLGPAVHELRRTPLRRIPYRHACRLGRFVRTAEQVVGWLTAATLDLTRTLFYSYWFEAVPVGLAAFQRWDARLVYVSRAGGWDVYEERHDPPWFPFRAFAAGGADRIFSASEHAAQHLRSRAAGAAVEVAPLGVPDHGLGHPSADGVLRIASCSNVIDLKRVDFIAAAVSELARRHPERHFEWTHVGDGPARARLPEAYPRNLAVRLLGRLAHGAVLDRYRSEPVDVFVHASTSEGGRVVAIMEALNAGIPVVATDVGGVPELIDADVGALVPAGASAGDLAHALFQKRGDNVRANARARWKSECDAAVRFPAFCRRLLTS